MKAPPSQLTIPTFKSIEDLQRFYYGGGDLINKADSFAETSSAGYFNNVYGGYLWLNLNFEGNLPSILPKISYTRSGYRIVTDPVSVPAKAGEITPHGGTAEGGPIADAVIPAIHTIKFKPKVTQIAFGTTVVQEWLAGNSDDDVAGSLEQLRLFIAQNYAFLLAQKVSADAESEALNTDRLQASTLDVESVDRIVSSRAEEAAVGGSGSHNYNPWRDGVVDRDTTNKFDCVVESATGGAINSGNSRLAKKTLINTKAKINRSGGGDATVIVTNQEVMAQIQQLYEQNTKYAMGEKIVSYTVNGVSTAEGIGVGLVVPSLYGTPVIVSQHLNGNPTDTKEIGRMYYLDTSAKGSEGVPRIGMQVAVPPLYNEIGAVNGQSGGVMVLGRFANKALFWSMSEILAVRYRGHGKIRDIGE